MSTDNYLDRQLERMAELAGLANIGFRILLRTTATHFQKHGAFKDTQSLLRHADAATTLGIYQQTITKSLTSAVEEWDAMVPAPKPTLQ